MIGRYRLSAPADGDMTSEKDWRRFQGSGAYMVDLGYDHLHPAHTILSFLERSKSWNHECVIRCTINNSIIELEKTSPEDYKPGNLASVPCTKEACLRWRDGRYFLLVNVENGRMFL
jgi:hypothetical protein